MKGGGTGFAEMFLKLCGDKRLCVLEMVNLWCYCSVRSGTSYSLMLAVNLGVVGVKAEGCNHSLLSMHGR